jgi:hypothetical protein
VLGGQEAEQVAGLRSGQGRFAEQPLARLQAERPGQVDPHVAPHPVLANRMATRSA